MFCSQNSFTIFGTLFICFAVGFVGISGNLRQSIQKHHSQKTKSKGWTRKTKTSTERPCVGLVVRTMPRMSSGFVVMRARSGSMGSVWRSLLLEPSTLSSTNARHAATRELALDDVVKMYSLSLSLCLFVLLISV